MPDSVRLVDPDRIGPNPENPRLIFHKAELDELQESIEAQGILVPLSVYEGKGAKLTLLDGERRWRCARKIGLSRVPVIVQPTPTKIQNIMMMFAIHKARQDWDPLPTAYKLEKLEGLFSKQHSRVPTEAELAQLASIPRGEVRRLKSLLALPKSYRDELMDELEKPRSEQIITADHVLETTRGAAALRKREVFDARTEDKLRRALLAKFRSKKLKNTTDPRKLARIARAVERKEVGVGVVRRTVARLIDDPDYTIDDAFRDSVEVLDVQHTLEQLADRVTASLERQVARRLALTQDLRTSLRKLKAVLERIDLA